jgi:Predicted helicase
VSGGLFGWIGDGLAEIGNQFTGVFKSDDAASNSGETKGTTTSRNQERGRASYLQGQYFERYTEQQLDEFGLNALWDENNLVYDETLEQYGKTTQVDVLIRDANDNEVAIIECKAYTSKWNGDDAVDQARRLVSLANERGIPLIFSTYDGTTDCFGSRVKEVLNQTQYFVISSDNIFFADPSDVKENGVTQGLPPELRSHWDWWFGQNYEPKSSCSSDYSSNDPNGFDSSYETESSSRPDYERSDPADSGGSWDLFSNLFGNSSESESSNSSNSSSIDSDSRESSDYGNSNYGSGDYGDSGGSDSSSSSSDSWW